MKRMSQEDFQFSSDDFSGTARLFPLPNVVMFPHVLQPLHIFEPRYRQMLEESLEGDGLIAMAVLAPGWEDDYEGRPQVRLTACLCHVAAHCKTEKGTYNVLMVGVRRIQIVKELPPSKLFREAEVEVVEDFYPSENKHQRMDLQRRLVRAFRRVLPKFPTNQEQIEKLLAAEISLGMLTDIVAYTLKLDQKIKEDLLAQPLPDLRALLLLECLGARGRPLSLAKFPPEFSLN
jgi:Lon protease-like protein